MSIASKIGDCSCTFKGPQIGKTIMSLLFMYELIYIWLYYRVIALTLVNVVPRGDIEGRDLASVRIYPNERQYIPLLVQ